MKISFFIALMTALLILTGCHEDYYGPYDGGYYGGGYPVYEGHHHRSHHDDDDHY